MHSATHRLRSSAEKATSSGPGELVPVILALRPASNLPTIEDLCAAPHRAPLSYEDFKAQYGTPPADLDRVKAWVDTWQLRLPDPDWRAHAELSGMLKLEGTLEQLREAFCVADLRYVERDATGYYTHEQEPDLGDIRALVHWVYGLETSSSVYRTTTAYRQDDGDRDRLSRGGLRAYAPRDIAKIYAYPPNEGEQQRQGLVELSGVYAPLDVERYFRDQGLAPTIIDVNLGIPNGSSSLANIEVTLDIELLASVSPGAMTVVYNACSRDFSIRDFFNVFSRAVFDTVNCPAVLSTSWGYPEFVPPVSGRGPGYLARKAEEEPFNVLFRKAALLGITLCASSGDTGSLIPFTEDGTVTGAILVPVTNFPAASPLVLGCGGTTLDVRDLRVVSEVVWNQLGQVLVIDSESKYPLTVTGGASGGGVSPLNDLPSYQSQSNVPHVIVTTWNNGVYRVAEQRPGRGVPDVAANADFSTGYKIFFDGHHGVCGGTSSAAPMWAALVTRMNRALGRRVGFFNPRLYGRQNVLKDLCNTTLRGTNGAYCASEALWNACTGLGSPNGMKILAALRGESSSPV